MSGYDVEKVTSSKAANDFSELDVTPGSEEVSLSRVNNDIFINPLELYYDYTCLLTKMYMY